MYISYFYNVRFFPSNIIPVSTAVKDPSWFHRGPIPVFIDHRGVVNGIRCWDLSSAATGNGDCYYCRVKHPEEPCFYLKDYRKHIYSLNFKHILRVLTNLEKKYKGTVCLMVYEKPDNPCSERHILKEWFAENGYPLEEWSPAPSLFD